jgi:hypothetical protein
MSIHYGTVEAITGSAVKIDGRWFTIKIADVERYEEVWHGDRVSYRADATGHILKMDVVAARS